jgi:hypothetical protein
MAIVWVRQFEGRDERLVTCDQAIGHRVVDPAFQAGGLLLCDVWDLSRIARVISSRICWVHFA